LHTAMKEGKEDMRIPSPLPHHPSKKVYNRTPFVELKIRAMGISNGLDLAQS
ncbi:hypothetical protein KI387_018898, partial [Taxus chinensis]